MSGPKNAEFIGPEPPEPHDGEVKRAEPESEPSSSPVLRSNVGGTGGGDWRRCGAQRRPPPAPGLSKAHISARTRQGTVTWYRKASLMQVRLRTDVAAGKGRSAPRGEIVEFTSASRRRMLELLARIEQEAVPLFVTLTYPDDFPLYREDYKSHLEAFCDRIQRRWPTAAMIWKLEFQERKSGTHKGKIAPHYHLFLFGVPWRFRYKEERGRFVCLWRASVHGETEYWNQEIEAGGERQCAILSVRGELPDGGEFPDGQVYGADSLRCWVSRNWYDVVASNVFAHYQAGTRVERLKTVKGAFAYAGKRYMAKKEEMPEIEHKPGRFWGVIGRKNLPLGKREDREVTASDAVQLRRLIRRCRWAKTPPEKRRFLRKSQLWAQEFTAKLFCNVEFWRECLLRWKLRI
jgi:hypothetical protein